MSDAVIIVLASLVGSVVWWVATFGIAMGFYAYSRATEDLTDGGGLQAISLFVTVFASPIISSAAAALFVLWAKALQW